jgi:hypothetical protein
MKKTKYSLLLTTYLFAHAKVLVYYHHWMHAAGSIH